MSDDDYFLRRFVGFRDRPRMWGSNEVVESLAIQLLELEAREKYPSLLQTQSNVSRRAYHRALSLRFPSDGRTPLFRRFKGEEFGLVLYEVCMEARKQVALMAQQMATNDRSARLASDDGRPKRVPSFLQRDALIRSATNVWDDTRQDWLIDPWDWPELRSVELLLPEVRDTLADGGIIPPLLIDVPKSAYATRPGVLLGAADRVAFQLCVDNVSGVLLGSLSPNVFGWRLQREGPIPGVYASNRNEWLAHLERVDELTKGYRYVLRMDVGDFFASISPRVALLGLSGTEAYPFLESFLRAFQTTPGRSGLPQRCLASSVLAQGVLRPVDNTLMLRDGISWCRWMDDYLVFSNSIGNLTSCIREVEDRLADLRLMLSARKTEVCNARDVARFQVDGVDTGDEVTPSAIDRKKLALALDAALSLEEQAPRSLVRYLASRLRMVENREGAKEFAQMSDKLPHAADALAELLRATDLADERSDWFLDYAQRHTCGTEWTVAAWARMYSADPKPSAEVMHFFLKRLADRRRSPPLGPTAACRSAQWSPQEAEEALRATAGEATSYFERRAGTLALAQLGVIDTPSRGQTPLLEFAARRSLQGVLHPDFRTDEQPTNVAASGLAFLSSASPPQG